MKTNTATALFLVLSLVLPAAAQAERVQEQLPNGLSVNAEYLPVANENPAVLLLRGFLQTFDFLATRNLINGISALDYTVLAPNLSLGIPDRKQSVQCSAAHTHTHQKDLAEIDFWIEWLKKKGYRSVILVGHSWGSQQSLGYMLEHTGSPVIGVIAISLVRTRQNTDTKTHQVNKANEYKKNKDKSLHAYELSFCNEYMATADSYISYAKWTDAKVLTTLSALQQHRLPVYVIVGGKDKRIGDKWLAAIKPRVTKVVKIQNANHFFSHISEFDLNDQLEILLPEITK
jgi:pimeloyl-ACP methyl ester carboxylesterase